MMPIKIIALIYIPISTIKVTPLIKNIRDKYCPWFNAALKSGKVSNVFYQNFCPISGSDLNNQK